MLACYIYTNFARCAANAAREYTEKLVFDARFDSTIPAGAPTCHFTMWRYEEGSAHEWVDYTDFVNKKALKHTEEQGRNKGDTAD